MSDTFETGRDYHIVTERIVQPENHYNKEGGYFEQLIKILVPEKVTSNPIVFFVLGNESAISDKKIADLYKAYGRRKDMILLTAEHRGYGQSITDDADQTVPGYVSIEQVLADYEAVVQYYRDRYTGPWIAAGYSYGGGLAINFAYKYPNSIKAVLSSSGVVNWDLLLDSYEIQVKENLGKGFYERLVRHVDRLAPGYTFDRNWHDRELIYAYVTALSQYENYNRRYLGIINFLSCLPTRQFIGILRLIDRAFLNNSANDYAVSNSKPSLTREEALSGRYSWRVWRYQQFFETGTLWKASFPGGLYKNTIEDWSKECEYLFGETPPLLKKGIWRVDELVDKLQVPLIYVNGGKDPWKRVCLPQSHQIRNGAYIYFEEGFHCPDREVPGEKGERRGEIVINEILRHINI